MSGEVKSRIEHRYQVVIKVTPDNKKELENTYGKILLVGDTLSVNLEQTLQPTPAVIDLYVKIGQELGGITRYQRQETITSDWVTLKEEI